MTDLISRLEKAEGGSRELDRLVAATRGDYGNNGDEYKRMLPIAGDIMKIIDEFGFAAQAIHYTTSLDAAMGLVPGWDWELEYNSDENGESGIAICRMGDPMLLIDGEAATPALALVIACLRAMEAGNG